MTGRSIAVPVSVTGPMAMPPPPPPSRRVIVPDSPLTLLLAGGLEVHAERWYEGEVNDDGLAAVVDAAGYVYLVPVDQVLVTIVSPALAGEMAET